MLPNNDIPNPPANPNRRNLNRVPLPLELARLKMTYQSNIDSITRLNDELAVRKAEYHTLYQAYEEKMCELHSMESTLSTAHSSIAFREVQKKHFVSQNDELQGLIHPIRRYPDDILRMIFICVVEDANSNKGMMEYWSKSSFRLAHACHRWRIIALETSQLWRYIRIPIGASFGYIQSYKKFILQHLNSTSANIGLCLEEDKEKVNIILKQFTLLNFKSIAYLEIRAGECDDPGFIFKGPYILYGRNIETFAYNAFSQNDQAPVDISFILQRLPHLQQLELLMDSSSNFVMSGGTSFSSLRKLKLEAFCFCTSLSTLSRLINLRELDLLNVDVPEDPPSPIQLPKLTSLSIINSSGIPFHLLQTSSLRSFKWDNENTTRMEDDVIAFISQNPTLRELDVWIGDSGALKGLVGAAPGIEFLRCFGFSWDSSITLSSAFPNLVRLEYDITRFNESTYEDWVALLRLCHKARKRDRLDLSPSVSLSIFYCKLQLEKAKWREDVILMDAVQLTRWKENLNGNNIYVLDIAWSHTS